MPSLYWLITAAIAGMGAVLAFITLLSSKLAAASWVNAIVNYLNLARLSASAASTLRSALKRRGLRLTAPDLTKLDRMYVSIMRDVLGPICTRLLELEARASGLEDGGLASELGQLRERVCCLAGKEVCVHNPLKPVMVERAEGGFHKRILDYVNLAAIGQCTAAQDYSLELERAIMAGDMESARKWLRRLRDAIYNIERLRQLLRQALMAPSAADLIGAIRERIAREDGESAYDPVFQVAEAFLYADAQRKAYKRLALKIAQLLDDPAITPVGKPFVSKHELEQELRSRAPMLKFSDKDFEKAVKHLESEGLTVAYQDEHGTLMLMRPKGLGPEVHAIIELVKKDEYFRENGFSDTELLDRTGWEPFVVKKVIEEMSRLGLIWPVVTPSGRRWFVRGLYEEVSA